MGEVTDKVKNGEMSASIGNSIASLSRSLVAAIESAQSADKLRSLEHFLTTSPLRRRCRFHRKPKGSQVDR